MESETSATDSAERPVGPEDFFKTLIAKISHYEFYDNTNYNNLHKLNLARTFLLSEKAYSSLQPETRNWISQFFSRFVSTNYKHCNRMNYTLENFDWGYNAKRSENTNAPIIRPAPEELFRDFKDTGRFLAQETPGAWSRATLPEGLLLAVLNPSKVYRSESLYKTLNSTLRGDKWCRQFTGYTPVENLRGLSPESQGRRGQESKSQMAQEIKSNSIPIYPVECRTKLHLDPKEMSSEDLLMQPPHDILYSEYPEHVIRYFLNIESASEGIGIQFGSSKKWFSKVFDFRDLKRDLSPLPTSALLRTKEEQYNKKLYQIYSLPVTVGPNASFNCNSLPELISAINPCTPTDGYNSFNAGAFQALESSNENKKVKALKISRLWRGSKEVDITQQEIDIQNLKSNKSDIYVYPYIQTIHALDPSTSEVTTALLFCLGFNHSLEKIITYKKSLKFFPNFLSDLIEDHSMLEHVSKGTYTSYAQAAKDANGEFWDGITRIFQTGRNAKKYTFHFDPTVSFGDLAHMQAVQTAGSAIEQAAHYQKLLATLQKVETSIRSASSQLRVNESDVQYYEEKVAIYSKALKEYEDTLEVNLKKQKATSKQKSQYLKTQQELMKEKEISKTAAMEQVKANLQKKDFLVETQESTKVFLETLANEGILITDVIFWDEKEEVEIKLSERNEISFLAKYDDEMTGPDTHRRKRYTLFEVSFTTIKPFLIKVDYGEKGEECKKIAGGPYNVSLQKDRLKISLASTSACFGYYSAEEGYDDMFWIHPHTQHACINKMSYQDFVDFIEGWSANACLGDIAPTLFTGFENSCLKTIVFSAISWITNANSSDTWGKYWKWFPRANTVNFQLLEEKPIISEEPKTLIDAIESEIQSVDQSENHEDPLPLVPEEDIQEITQTETHTHITQEGYQPLSPRQFGPL